MTRPWRIRLGAEAEKDFVRILAYTRDTFGSRQVEIYKTTLLEAIAALADGPDVLGSAGRDEIQPAFAVIMSLEEVVRVGILSFIGLRLTM